MVIQRPHSVFGAPGKPRFLWWRLAFLVLTLLILGWGFNQAWLCQPAPTPSEQAVFYLALIVILAQTAQAGWLRNDDPWEALAFEYGIYVLKILVIIAGILVAILLIMFIVSLTDDLFLKLIIPIVLLLLVVWLITQISSDDK